MRTDCLPACLRRYHNLITRRHFNMFTHRARKGFSISFKFYLKFPVIIEFIPSLDSKMSFPLEASVRAKAAYALGKLQWKAWKAGKCPFELRDECVDIQSRSAVMSFVLLENFNLIALICTEKLFHPRKGQILIRMANLRQRST